MIACDVKPQIKDKVTVMIEAVNFAMIAEYENFVQNHPKGHFLQSVEWGKVKNNWKWEAIVSRDDNGKIHGSMAVLIRKIPALPFTLMYSPRGPVCDSHDVVTLTELTEGVRTLAKKYNAYSLMLDPDIEGSDTLFIKTMQELGYRLHDNGKNFDGVQPNFVFRLNVDGKTPDELMAQFHQKTRYNIRLASRKGVTVTLCDESNLGEMLPHFSRIMNETGERDGFIVRGEEYFARMMKSLGDHARLYMAMYNDKPVAGTLAIQYGDKVWYLYGASSNEYRNVMPNYLLQWSMINWAIETNCNIYDFRGVSGDLSPENPLYGLYLFKKGFSGDLVEFCGEMEYAFKPFVNKCITTGMNTARRVRHTMRTKK